MSNTQLILSRVLSSTKTEIYYSQATQIYGFLLLINEAALLVFWSKAYESHGEQTLDIVEELTEGNFTGEERIVVETTTVDGASVVPGKGQSGGEEIANIFTLTAIKLRQLLGGHPPFDLGCNLFQLYR